MDRWRCTRGCRCVYRYISPPPRIYWIDGWMALHARLQVYLLKKRLTGVTTTRIYIYIDGWRCRRRRSYALITCYALTSYCAPCLLHPSPPAAHPHPSPPISQDLSPPYPDRVYLLRVAFYHHNAGTTA